MKEMYLFQKTETPNGFPDLLFWPLFLCALSTPEGSELLIVLGWFSLRVFLSCIKQVFPFSGKTNYIFSRTTNCLSLANSSRNILLCLRFLVRCSELGIKIFFIEFQLSFCFLCDLGQMT